MSYVHLKMGKCVQTFDWYCIDINDYDIWSLFNSHVSAIIYQGFNIYILAIEQTFVISQSLILIHIFRCTYDNKYRRHNPVATVQMSICLAVLHNTLSFCWSVNHRKPNQSPITFNLSLESSWQSDKVLLMEGLWNQLPDSSQYFDTFSGGKKRKRKNVRGNC